MKLAIVDLSYCCGCDIALADLGESLFSLLQEVFDLVYAPLLMSAKDYDQVDVALVTGAVRTEEDVAELKKARERCKYLVAMGSCAAFGGLPGLANLCTHEEMMQAAYRTAPTVKDAQAKLPADDIPALVDTIKPLDAYVQVDLALPGCPPPPPVFVDFVKQVLALVQG
ncbi:MAG TPA: hypothetical protein PLB78_19065 [Anaerolineae bacterium]|nr:hypothetical protein [Anaerolineae bacterium]